MTATDWPAVRRIYAEGIASGDATFETEPPSWEEFDAGKLAGLRLVAVDGEGTVFGWGAASAVSSRAVYRGVVEHSVYVAADQRGQGVGRLILEELIAAAEAAGIWTLQSGVFPENEASLRLHASYGFRVVGVRERIGCLGGVWRDVVLIERRSPGI